MLPAGARQLGPLERPDESIHSLLTLQ
jgi:hypothetical protein